MIYLDNSATTPLAPEVAAQMEEFRARNFANASAVYRSGQAARVELEEVRETLATLLGAEAKEVIITSGGTEANNYALKGYAFACREETGAWPTLITARNEHHAILHPAEFLSRIGVTVQYADVNSQGRVTADALQSVLNQVTPGMPLLVSVMHANNETGAINPIAELATLTHEAGGVFHTDAVQTFGKMPCVAHKLGVDMLSVSAHKIHGPKGVGALYVNKQIELEPLIHGGAQERNRRGGTEAMELIVGFGRAATLAGEGQEEWTVEIEKLATELRGQLATIEGVQFVTPETGALPNIVTVTFTDAAQLDGEGLIVGMDIRGVAVSNGSACTSGSIQPSHVLTAMGFLPEQAKGAVRFSLSRYTTRQDIQAGVGALQETLAQMRKGR